MGNILEKLFIDLNNFNKIDYRKLHNKDRDFFMFFCFKFFVLLIITTFISLLIIRFLY